MGDHDIPYFMWDYNLTNAQIKHLLQNGTEAEKKWLMGKILTHARFDDIWNYFSLAELAEVFQTLHMSGKSKKNWQTALQVWGYKVDD